MAMRIAAVPHFWATVKFSMIGDLEQSIEVSFRVKYKRLEQDEYESLVKRVQAARLAFLTSADGASAQPAAVAKEAELAGAKPISDLQVIEEVVLDWQDVLDGDDQPLPFTKDNLARALSALGCKAAIVKRFFDLHAKEAEKNFAPRPVTTSGS